MNIKKNSKQAIIALAACSSLFAQSTNAQLVNLSDGGSSVSVELSGSGAGMNSWYLDNAPLANQLNKQWFYYRIGGGLAQPINNIGTLSYTTSGSNIMEATYSNPQFSLTISYVLTGGGSGTGNADIAETISVLNTSGSSLNFHLFQYSDFNLLGTPGGDSVQIGVPDSAIQWEGTSGISEGVLSPPADRVEAALASSTLVNLTTIPGYDLNNVTGNPTPLMGDVTWAFQWDRDIANGQSLDVFKDKQLSIVTVPEPGVLAIVGAGLLALAMRKK
jgi:hypothetical protein